MKKKRSARQIVSVVVVIAMMMSLASAPVFGAGANVKITYDSNGGNPASYVTYAANGAVYPQPGTPAKTGFSFDGWFTSEVGGEKITAATGVYSPTNKSGSPTSAITVYAHWAKPIKITFKLTGGKFTIAQKKKYKSNKKTVTTSRVYGTLPAPRRSGYRFFGWWVGSDRVDKASYVEKTKAHTLTAKWLKSGKKSTVEVSELKLLQTSLDKLNNTGNSGYYLSITDVKAVVGGAGKKSFSYNPKELDSNITVYYWRTNIEGYPKYLYCHFIGGKYLAAITLDKTDRFWD